MKTTVLGLLIFITPAFVGGTTVDVRDGISVVKVEEYKTVCDCDPNIFDSRINDLIKQGWRLYGFPYVNTSSIRFRCICQVLVKISTNK